MGNRYATAHHSSLQAISAREVGLLPPMSWALSWSFRVRSGSMNICELTTMETPMCGLSRRHGHSVLNLTLIVYDLCVLEVPTAQLAVGGWVGRLVLARGPLHRAHSVTRVGGMHCYCWCSMSFVSVTAPVESSVALSSMVGSLRKTLHTCVLCGEPPLAANHRAHQYAVSFEDLSPALTQRRLVSDKM